MQENIAEMILADFSQQNNRKEAVDTLFQYLYFNIDKFNVFQNLLGRVNNFTSALSLIISSINFVLSK